MKFLAFPLIVFILVFSGFVTFLIYSTERLPRLIATSRTLSGEIVDPAKVHHIPLSRAKYLRMIWYAGTLIPLTFAGIGLTTQLRKDRSETRTQFNRRMIWAGCAVAFVFAMAHASVMGNNDPSLQIPLFWWTLLDLALALSIAGPVCYLFIRDRRRSVPERDAG